MSRPCLRAVAVVFVALLVGVVAFVIARKRTGAPAAGPGHPTSLVSRELVDQFTALETREQELNKTVWAKEMLAEECGRVFESLWDSLNASTNKFGVL
ncbi:MAG TPA: hypothetical protein VEL06_07270, partial [Haliangiales bacterium]|nr:hypothetical protein [Haliangiales bacterium]